MAGEEIEQAKGSALPFFLLLVVAAPVWAEIKIKTLEDGTSVIYNEPADARVRRVSDRLLPAPQVELARMIDVEARRQGLDPRLVRAVVQVESGYNPRARSRKGAMGLMQLMPATVRDYGVDDPFEPRANLRAGTAYLRRLRDRYDGELALALAAYNAGPSAVARYGGLPPYPETERYVAKVLALFRGTVPALVQEHLRSVARQRERKAAFERQRRAASQGKKVYLTRDENDVIVLTTTPPGSP